MNPETSQGDDRCEDCNSQSTILHFKQCNQNSVIKPTVAWFHCLLQDSIIFRMVSYMGIKGSPWVLKLGQLNPPLNESCLQVGINTWLCMEWPLALHGVLSDIQLPLIQAGTQSTLRLRIAPCRRVFCFILYFMPQ